MEAPSDHDWTAATNSRRRRCFGGQHEGHRKRGTREGDGWRRCRAKGGEESGQDWSVGGWRRLAVTAEVATVCWSPAVSRKGERGSEKGIETGKGRETRGLLGCCFFFPKEAVSYSEIYKGVDL